MKKKIKIKLYLKTTVIFCIMLVIRKSYALSENFTFMIDRVGIPMCNVYREEINEDIYNLYNIFVYGSPVLVSKVNYAQRWKSFQTGLWQYGAGPYRGYGIRGEYSILGRDYNGEYIYNYYFPLDRVPSTTPDRWNYIVTKDAISSWQDKSKYKYIEQIVYMQETNWLFSDITGGKNNPYNQIQYGINALQIGLNKARLETCATWKSRGTIYTSIIGETGNYGYAMFAVPPMAENAYLNSEVIVNEYNELDESEDELIIPIEYKVNVCNTTKYATKDQIEELTSKLYINGSECNSISGSKIMSMGNKYMLVISRDKFPPTPTPYKIVIRLDSFLETAFVADGLLQNSVTKEIQFLVKSKPLELISKFEVAELLKKDNKWVVSPLAQINKRALGVTEAGKALALKLDVPTVKDICYRVLINGNEIKEIKVINSSSMKEIVLIFKLPMELKTSLYGWASLRDTTNNYFKINSVDIGSVKNEPHIVTIIATCGQSETIKEFLIDTVDNYLSNINRDITDKVINSKREQVELENWIN